MGSDLVFTAFLTFGLLLAFIHGKTGGEDDGSFEHWLAGLDLKQIFTLQGLVLAFPAFLILGLALWSIGK